MMYREYIHNRDGAVEVNSPYPIAATLNSHAPRSHLTLQRSNLTFHAHTSQFTDPSSSSSLPSLTHPTLLKDRHPAIDPIAAPAAHSQSLAVVIMAQAAVTVDMAAEEASVLDETHVFGERGGRGTRSAREGVRISVCLMK
jgi:hypothetical protein